MTTPTEVIEKIIGEVVAACYDLEQTKPKVCAVLDKAVADIKEEIKNAEVRGRELAVDKMERFFAENLPYHPESSFSKAMQEARQEDQSGGCRGHKMPINHDNDVLTTFKDCKACRPS